MVPGADLDELARAECLALLATVPVGRVGVSIEALPAVLPVNHLVVDDAVVFRSPAGTKLSAATRGAVVAFEADSYEQDGSAGWSVLVRGVASEITGVRDLDRLRALPLESWALDGKADHWVRIECTMVTGRRFRRVG